MPIFDSSQKVWLTGFWGFSPEEEGILGFTHSKDRDRLHGQIAERQLVSIYGAANPETDNKIVHHLLGVLEIERTPIDAWDKMSDAAKARNIAAGRQDKWRQAMPVRRAWRTTHTLDVKQIFPLSYDPDKGRYIAKFGTWLVDEEANWLLTSVPFTETDVFGEPSLVRNDDVPNQPRFLKPSQGVFGSFGQQTYETIDKPHQLYLAIFPSFPELLAGVPVSRESRLIKIGISGDLKNRFKALNLSFPKSSTVGWKISRTAQFESRSSAAGAENTFKSQAIDCYGASSLGNEFFIMDIKKAEALFNKLSLPTGLNVRTAKATNNT